MNTAVFLDRDGVINRTVWNAEENVEDSPYRLEDFELLPRAAEAIRWINCAGYLAVVVSNQPGIAKGKCSAAFLQDLTQLMRDRLAAKSARLDGVYYCLHHPQAAVPEYRLVCGCRKPRAGLLHQAARDLDIDIPASFMIGDQQRDIDAALEAGCASILVGSTHEPSAAQQLTAGSLYEAVGLVTRHD